MSRNSTLARLRADVENQADIVGAASRYPPTLINRLINQSIQRFRERISNEGLTHYLTATSGTLSSGATSPYSFQVLDLTGVSPGVVRTMGVDITVNGEVVSLEHRPFEERAQYGTQTGQPVAWAHFQTAKIAILPPPDGSYAYTVWYLPVLTDLSSDTDTFDGVAGWEDYVVWDTVCRLVTRDTYKDAYVQANQIRTELFADIVRSATKVSSAGGQHRARDTFGAIGYQAITVGRKRPPGGGGGSVGNDSITNAKLAEMAAYTIKGNATAATANPTDLTTLQVHALLQPRVYYVSDYGAAGNGTTDDTAAISAAIDAAQAAGGGTVMLMSNHRVTGALSTITVNNIIIKGRGKGFLAGTQIYIDGALPSCTPFVFSGCQYSGIEDLYARAGKVYTAECSLVSFSDTYACFVRRVRVDQHWSHTKIVSSNGTILEEIETAELYGLYGVLFIGVGDSSEGAEIRNSYFTGPHPYAFPASVVGNGAWASTTAYTQGDLRTNGGYLWQCSTSGTSAGSGGPSSLPAGDPGTMFATEVTDGTAKWRVIAPDTQAHVIQDSNAHSLRLFNTAFVNGVYPFVMRNALATTKPHFLFARDIETDHCWEAFVLNDGAEIRVTNASLGATLFGSVVRIDSGVTLDCQFANCKLYGGAKHGFDIGADGFKINDCSIGNNGQLASNTYDGIHIGSNVSSFSIQNNKSLNSGSGQRRGLTLNNGTSANYIIAGNDFTGNVTEDIYDGGSGVGKTVQARGARYPVFSGAHAGMVPTGAGNTSLFLSNAGTWLAPSVGGSVTGVTLSQLQNIASPRVVGRFTAGTGSAEQVTGAQVASMLPVFTTTAHGLTPYPSGGAAGLFLRDDSTWAAPAGGGGSSTGIANAQLAFMPPLTFKLNPAHASGLAQDASPLGAASMLPVFTGSAKGLTPGPTGGSLGRFLRDDGQWQGVPTFAGPPSGITLPQIGDLSAPRVLGRFAGSGAVEQLLGAQVASMLPVFTGLAHGLTPYPSGGISGRFLRDDGSWRAVPTFGAAPTGVEIAGLGAIEYNRILGRFSAGSGAVEQLTPTQVATMLPAFTITGKGVVPPPVTVSGNFLKDDGTWAAPAGGGGGGSGFPNGPPNTVQFNASGAFGGATGITIAASGYAMAFGSGGPYLHGSGIDMRSSDIRNARRINGLDGVKLYGEVPAGGAASGSAELVVASGTVFIVPPSVTVGQVYAALPTLAGHGDMMLLENRSGVTHQVNQGGTNSGWVATLAPSMGIRLRYGSASGSWEYRNRYQLGGF